LTTRKLFVIFVVVTPEAVTVDPVKVDNDNALVVIPDAVTVDPVKVETPNNLAVTVEPVTVEFIVRRLRVVEFPTIVLPSKEDICMGASNVLVHVGFPVDPTVYTVPVEGCTPEEIYVTVLRNERKFVLILS